MLVQPGRKSGNSTNKGDRPANSRSATRDIAIRKSAEVQFTNKADGDTWKLPINGLVVIRMFEFRLGVKGCRLVLAVDWRPSTSLFAQARRSNLLIRGSQTKHARCMVIRASCAIPGLSGPSGRCSARHRTPYMARHYTETLEEDSFFQHLNSCCARHSSSCSFIDLLYVYKCCRQWTDGQSS